MKKGHNNHNNNHAAEHTKGQHPHKDKAQHQQAHQGQKQHKSSIGQHMASARSCKSCGHTQKECTCTNCKSGNCKTARWEDDQE